MNKRLSLLTNLTKHLPLPWGGGSCLTFLMIIFVVVVVVGTPSFLAFHFFTLTFELDITTDLISWLIHDTWKFLLWTGSIVFLCMIFFHIQGMN